METKERDTLQNTWSKKEKEALAGHTEQEQLETIRREECHQN